MRVTVIGSGAACPPAGGNSSGYLVEADGAALLLDCGPGVAAGLLDLRPDAGIDAVVISHMHADHFIDLLALRFRLCRDLGGPDQRRVRLLLPPGGTVAIEQIVRAVCFPPDFIDNTFQVEEYDCGEIEIAAATVRFARGVHYVPSCAARVEIGGRVLAYTGDTAPSAAVAELARGADALLAEATLTQPETGADRGHMTPAQAAHLARRAGVRRLFLTHFWFDADRPAAAREAARIFPGAESVVDGMTIDL